MKHNIDVILTHYLNAVKFTEADEENDIDWDDDFHQYAIMNSRADIEIFLAKAEHLLSDWDDGQIGHDLWLTRNSHGVGFWDRDLPNGDELTKIAKSMGERYAIMGFDGFIRIE